jgi:hypothetical protein
MGGLGKVGGGVPVWVPAPRLIYAESFEILEFNMKTWAIPK